SSELSLAVGDGRSAATPATSPAKSLRIGSSLFGSTNMPRPTRGNLLLTTSHRRPGFGARVWRQRANQGQKIAAAQIARGGTMPSSKAVLLAALLLAGAGGAAHAQTYPSATVKLIVPVPAGGVTDTMARIVAQRLTEAWGQPVVVDNRPGGNYAVGAQAVAKSPPDGLTLLVAPDSTVTANPHLFSKLPYDP